MSDDQKSDQNSKAPEKSGSSKPVKPITSNRNFANESKGNQHRPVNVKDTIKPPPPKK